MIETDFDFYSYKLENGMIEFIMSRNEKFAKITEPQLEGELQKDVQALKAFNQLWEETKESNK